MIIRAKQLDVFQETADKNFINRVAGFLKEKHGNRLIKLPSRDILVSEIPDNDLRNLVQNGIRQARKFGLTWETSLTSFVVIMFIAAPNFYEHSTVNPLLQDESIEPDARIDRLTKILTQEDWQAVKESYDPQFWE